MRKLGTAAGWFVVVFLVLAILGAIERGAFGMLVGITLLLGSVLVLWLDPLGVRSRLPVPKRAWVRALVLFVLFWAFLLPARAIDNARGVDGGEFSQAWGDTGERTADRLLEWLGR